MTLDTFRRPRLVDTAVPRRYYLLHRTPTRFEFAILDKGMATEFARRANIGFIHDQVSPTDRDRLSQVLAAVPAEDVGRTEQTIVALHNQGLDALVFTVPAGERSNALDVRTHVVAPDEGPDEFVAAAQALAAVASNIWAVSLSDFTDQIVGRMASVESIDRRDELRRGLVAVHTQLALTLGPAACVRQVANSNGTGVLTSNHRASDASVHFGPRALLHWLAARAQAFENGRWILEGQWCSDVEAPSPSLKGPVRLALHVRATDHVGETLLFCHPDDSEVRHETGARRPKVRGNIVALHPRTS